MSPDDIDWDACHTFALPRLLYNACHVTWSEPRSEKLEEEVNYELPDEDYEDPYDPYGRK